MALNTVCRPYQVVRRDIVLENVELMNRDLTSCSWEIACRSYVLIALGEAYSSRSVPDEWSFPGAKYFAIATRLLRNPERPGVEIIENHLLMIGCTLFFLSPH